ncbi:MAG: hypothetical protein Tsb002_03720 [Wenzhouxiangellaceae bacterium]
MTHPKALKALVFLVFLSGAFWSLSSPVLAENLGEKANSSTEVVTKAYTYSFETLEKNDDMPGIGIIIGYGTGNAVTAEYVGDAFVSELNRRGYKARYFYYDAEWEGMTVEYRIGYSVLGPWDADSAAGQVSTATEHADAARRVHKSVKGEAGIEF